MPSMTALSDPLEMEIIRPLLRAEYDLLVERGAFEAENLELIEGRLIIMSPEGPTHAAVLSAVARLLMFALDGRATIRTCSPLAVSDRSEPEPDLAAVSLGDHSRRHPETAHLVVEISKSSLREDRLVKPALYAGAAIPEYWIVDLTSDTVTVHTQPGGAGFAREERYGRGQSITLTEFPDVTLSLDDFLPRL
jgi:Uma2 family endonuclease